MAINLCFMEMPTEFYRELGLERQLAKGGTVLTEIKLTELRKAAQHQERTNIYTSELQSTLGEPVVFVGNQLSCRLLAETAKAKRSVNLKVMRNLHDQLRVTIEAELPEGSALLFGGWECGFGGRNVGTPQSEEQRFVLVVIARPQLVED